MRGRIHVDQAQWTTRRGEDRGTRKGHIANADGELRPGTACAFRHAAAVAQLEVWKAERQAPGRRPLEPPCAMRALREFDMVRLLQPIGHGADRQLAL